MIDILWMYIAIFVAPVRFLQEKGVISEKVSYSLCAFMAWVAVVFVPVMLIVLCLINFS